VSGTALLAPITTGDIQSGEDAATRTFAPGAAAICDGVVYHGRTRPAAHSFTHPVSMVWVDPDRPEELFDRHPLWSSRRIAPVRFRRRDYGLPGSDEPLSAGVRRELAAVLGREPTGAVRMLTQARSFGWLFNPITLYLAWDGPATVDGDVGPVGVVAEVTNTPWKQRHRYAAALSLGPADTAARTATFPKELHVSPFLGSDLHYELDVRGDSARLEVAIDVLEDGRPDLEPILRTSLVLRRRPPTPRNLTRALLAQPFPTHRVSARIHREAARLWRKGVPFVRHPGREERSSSAAE